MFPTVKFIVSLFLIVRVGLRFPKTIILPAVDASHNATATAVDQVLDALAVNVTLPELAMVPLEADPKLTTWRAYPLPVSSVPDVESVGATLYNAT